jgi:RNA polymerase sigma-70 factor (ECF subfamily)
LRRIVKQQLIDIHRRHVHALRRTVAREKPYQPFVSDASAMQLAQRLVSREPSPSNQAGQREWLQKIKVAMRQLSSRERELLVMRFVEQLSLPEISQILAVPESSVRSRVRRTLEKLTVLVKSTN